MTNNVQERANREIKRRYRVVQSFPSVESMVRLSAASILSEEGRWATQRVFSEESAALGFRDPGPREALERRAAQIVSEIAESYGLKKE
jgi:putative transposase